MPDKYAVLAMTAGVADMQAVVNLVWQHLLPALVASPSVADRSANEQLTE
jgi:hypothetical protein